MKLSREEIVSEAIALMQEAGLAEVSLRKLAARFDARAPSLARHVGDKANLLALMSHRIFCEALADIPAGLMGADWLKAFGLALWRKQRATRDIGALLAIAPPNPPLETDLRQRLHAALDGAGLDGPRRELMQSSVQALVTGWTTFAQSVRAPRIEANLRIDAALEESLSALIAGYGEIG